MINLKKPTTKYAVISPDGFTIERTESYKTQKQAMDAFELFKKRYESQGYYSSMDYGRIPLDDLADYCQFLTITDNIK